MPLSSIPSSMTQRSSRPSEASCARPRPRSISKCRWWQGASPLTQRWTLMSVANWTPSRSSRTHSTQIRLGGSRSLVGVPLPGGLHTLSRALSAVPGGCKASFVAQMGVKYQFNTNDDFCDCSSCADEVDWTCGTCGASAEQEEETAEEKEETAVGVGVGVGVSTGLALGIGLGVGLGTGIGAGTGTAGTGAAGAAGVAGVAALAAQGLLRLQTQNTATLQDPNVVNALKDTIARLSGSGIAAAMVELIINCANAGATSDMSAVPAVTLPSGTGQPSLRQAMERPGPSATPMLRVARRLQAMVGVCFQVQVEDSSAEEVCQTLSSYDTNTVQTVLSSELLEAGVNPEEVSVVGYDATPNPRSYNPLEGADTNFFAPAPGIDLGRL
ncbi:Uncharacterized protein SCF082_LOCUS7417 [Durusdinium trenchii]|uniref:Uncharacterized protein n=1 Tax=Durusdinium trenchii TaxID=1381693 RepID=A0ABP0IJ21_9DINO